MRKLYIEIQNRDNFEMRRTFLELRDLEHSVEEKPDAEILQKLREVIELEDIE